MSTEKTIRDYFAAIHRGGWQDFLAEDMTYGFNSALQDLGKEDYLNGAGNFLAMTIDVDVKHLVIDGDQAYLPVATAPTVVSWYQKSHLHAVRSAEKVTFGYGMGRNPILFRLS